MKNKAKQIKEQEVEDWIERERLNREPTYPKKMFIE